MMKNLLFAAVGAALVIGCSGDDSSGDDTAYEAPGATAHGATPAEWTARWWQWAFAIPVSQHPIYEGDCTEGQSGDVFFLAGNTGGTSVRACTVPAGKALYFPLSKYICFPAPEFPDEGCDTPYTEAALTACANHGIDRAQTTMTVTVDGEVLEDAAEYRTASDVFSWTAPADPSEQLYEGIGPIPPNACGISVGDRFGVTDGYWVMLRPLEPGEHTLHFTSSVVVGGLEEFALDVTYHLTQE